MANRLLAKVFFLLAAATAWPSCTIEQSSPKDVLKRVLRGQRSVDYLHIETRSFGGGSSTAKVKVQTVVGKGIMVTILEPIDRANIVTVDDAKESKTFFPDQDQLLVQPSPVLLQPDFDLRWRLINENYSIKQGGWGRIADQRVREFVLVPLNDEVPVRRMFIDPKHFVTLKYVVEREAEEDNVIFDTKYVDFGRQAADAGFGLPARASSARRVNAKGPTRIAEPSDSRPGAGFTTRWPTELPCGFEVSGAYLFGSGKSSYVSVKLTDGMVTLTVYQWLRDKGRRPPDATMVAYDRHKVGYGIAVVPGDHMPESVLEQLLGAFMKKGG